MADDIQLIRDAAKKWETSYNDGNFDLLATYYAEGAALLPPEGPRLTDRDNFGNIMKGLRENGLVRVCMDILDVEASGDLGWASNISSMYDADNKKVSEFKTLEIWKKVDGSWLLYRDMFSPV